MRLPYRIAIEVDRCLSLSLSNNEFEILVGIIIDSEDPELTAKNIINCGSQIAFYIIELSK